MKKVNGVISYNLRKQDSTSNKRCINLSKSRENKIIIKNMRNLRGKDVEKIKKRDADEWWKELAKYLQEEQKKFFS